MIVGYLHFAVIGACDQLNDGLVEYVAEHHGILGTVNGRRIFKQATEGENLVWLELIG